MISVVIAARNEKYLNMTLESVYASSDDVEFIVVLDGDYSDPVIQLSDRFSFINNDTPQGIRRCLNQAVNESKGDYILKLDAHCTVARGLVHVLRMQYEEDTVMVARRWTLDLNTKTLSPRNVDYYYLSCPWTHPRGMMMQSCPWISKTEKVHDKHIDDLMCFQGSMWFMSRKHWDWLGGLETDLEYAEHHEISMKTWLGGKRVRTNKNTFYGHPAKIERGYHMSMNRVYKDHDISARRWMDHPGFADFIEKFWPLPTENNRHRTEKYYWQEDWRERYAVVS